MIKEAERLYKNIDETQSHLIKARLDKDRIREHLELIGLETIVFDAKQLLKCIIDRKDNIVDLGEVWHTLDLKSKPDVDIAYLDIVAIVDNDILRDINTLNGLYEWLRYNSVIQGQVKWAYLKDLLPKGGN